MDREKSRIKKEVEKSGRFPPEPVRDVLQFLLDHAPLKRWQHEILEIVRMRRTTSRRRQ